MSARRIVERLRRRRGDGDPHLPVSVIPALGSTCTSAGDLLDPDYRSG